MSRAGRDLSTTSYAILGLLAIRPWSTYELAKQMRRNLHYFWPSAESHLYAEPKRLVEGGFARAQSQPVGKRRRTVYSITTKGRRALEHWLSEPASESRLESETLVKIMFAPFGSKDDLLAHLHRFRAEQTQKQESLRAIFDEYLAGHDPFPERAPINVLCYRLIWDSTTAAATWADWAIDRVEQWPDATAPNERKASMRVLQETLALPTDEKASPPARRDAPPGQT